MRKLGFAIIALLAATAMAQPGKNQTDPTPDDPIYFDEYRAAALALVDSVTTSVDDIKQFRESPRFASVARSSVTQELYREKIRTLQTNLALVQQNLLSTPTAVLNSAAAELHAIEQMNQYRE